MQLVKKISVFLILMSAVLVVGLAVPAMASNGTFPLETDCQGYDPEDPYGIRCGQASGLTQTDPRIVVGRIINIALSLLGIVAVVIIIYAGFKWMTAGGNEENIKSAQKILIAAVIGLVIILSAYAISNFVLESLYRATEGADYPR